MKNAYAEAGSEGIGEEIVPVAGAAWHDGFLHDFGEAAVCDADDDGQPKCSFPVGFSVGDELSPVAPKAEEGESGIHEDMHHLVKSDNGLGVWKHRTRDSGQNQDDDSAQDSRVAISCQSFQGLSRSLLRKRRRLRGCRVRRRRSL